MGHKRGKSTCSEEKDRLSNQSRGRSVPVGGNEAMTLISNRLKKAMEPLTVLTGEQRTPTFHDKTRTFMPVSPDVLHPTCKFHIVFW